MKLSEERFIQGQITEILVDVVKILSGQYLRYFSYGAFCDLYDNVNDEVFNGSFVVDSLQSRLIKFLLRNLMLRGVIKVIIFIGKNF